MNACLLLPMLLAQDPAPAPVEPPKPPPDPRILFTEWAGRLEKAPVVHVVAEGFLVTADPVQPGRSVRWTFETDVWLAKGGRAQAKTRWTGPKPEQGEPEKYTSIAYADGKRSWQGFEGGEPLKPADLTFARFVPYPLPEAFGAFDAKPEEDFPIPLVAKPFDWGEPVRTMPTALVLDPLQPETEPATWYGFAEKELAGWCTMMPERLGGDVLRGKVKKLERLEKLPEKEPPRFEPEAR